MGRSSDQAKLLLFGLLRTVSALASTQHRVAPVCSQAIADASFQQNQPDLTLRLAHRTDVPSIQRCNLATLPENYNQQFYSNHLRQWPELAIVVECAPEQNDDQASSGDQLDGQGRLLLKPDSHYSFSPFPNGKKESNIVAYVIGKVEEHVEESIDESQEWGPAPGFIPPGFKSERLGHVTSLAVLEPYRRRGLANALMEQLHYHMESYYGVKWVGLHVRHSNTPAVNLYRGYGYSASELIPAYYQDGEDAFLMKKGLEPQGSRNKKPYSDSNSLPFFGNLRRSKGREVSPHLVLPRQVGRPLPDDTATTNDDEEESSSASSELLTGTM